jgi:hypothetical protein
VPDAGLLVILALVDTAACEPSSSVAVTVHVPVAEGAEKIPDVLPIVPQVVAQVTSVVAEN